MIKKYSAREEAMNIALQLFGYLILTVLAIVAPIFIVLLSIFQEGVSKLSAQYEIKKIKSEENLEKQWNKQNKPKKADVKEMEERLKKIKQVIKQIKSDIKTAEVKLAYLDPKKQMARLFIRLMLSFSGVVLAILIKTDILYTVIIILVSVISFTAALIILWKLLGIIVEVKKVIDEEKRETEIKTVDVLLALQEKLTTETEEVPLFLEDVYLSIGSKAIKDEEREFKFQINNKTQLKVAFQNDENVMVKNFEAGITLPSDFIVEKSKRYRITTDMNGDQTIRFKTDKIQAKTNYRFRSLIFTPIVENEYKIWTFIKAENIKPIRREIKIKIKEETPAEEIPEHVEPF